MLVTIGFGSFQPLQTSNLSAFPVKKNKYIVIISKDPAGEQDKAVDKLQNSSVQYVLAFLMQTAEPLLNVLFYVRCLALEN